MALDCQLRFPLLVLLASLPLVHGATVSVRQDLIDIIEEHSSKEGMLVADHSAQSRLHRPGLRLRIGLPDAHIEIKRAREQSQVSDRELAASLCLFRHTPADRGDGLLVMLQDGFE